MEYSAFNFKRFANLVAFDFNSHRNQHIAFVAVVLALGIFSVVPSFILPRNLVYGLFMLVCVLGPLYMTSHLMRNLNNPSERIDFLMFPASNLEKYAARLVNMVIFPYVLSSLAMTLFNTARIAEFYHEAFAVNTTMPTPWAAIWSVLILTYAFLAHYLGLNILMATVIKRFSFIVTQIVFFGGLIPLSYALNHFGDELVTTFFVNPVSIYTADGETFNLELHWGYYILLTYFVLITVGSLWASYKIFCRKTA